MKMKIKNQMLVISLMHLSMICPTSPHQWWVEHMGGVLIIYPALPVGILTLPYTRDLRCLATCMDQKTVLVSLSGHKRPLSVNDESQIKDGVRELFSDILPPGSDFFLQIHDESWGEFVDLMPGQTLHDRAVIQANVIEQVYMFLTSVDSHRI